MAERPGASLAVLTENENGLRYVLAIQRDNDPSIAYPGYWELPGGTLEPTDTSPEEGALRECLEELGVDVLPSEIHGNDHHLVEGISNATLVVAMIAYEKALTLRLGDEGTACAVMELDAFLEHPNVIPEHSYRLRRYVTRELGHLALMPHLSSAA